MGRSGTDNVAARDSRRFIRQVDQERKDESPLAVLLTVSLRDYYTL